MVAAVRIVSGWLLAFLFFSSSPLDDVMVQLVRNSIGDFTAPNAVLAALPKIQAELKRPGVGLGGVERLIAMAPDGSVLGVVAGTERGVILGAEFDRPLLKRGAGILLVHNHPNGASLSAADLGQLSKAGTAGIIAIGHDGSVYAATQGSDFEAEAIEASLYPLARLETELYLARERASYPVRNQAITSLFEHLVASALHKAEAIRYRAVLGPGRQTALSECVPLCGHVTEAVASRLKHKIRDKRKGRIQ